MKIAEILNGLKKPQDRSKRQDLPTGPDKPSFAMLLASFKQTEDPEHRTHIRNSIPKTLADYRTQALPVRSQPQTEKQRRAPADPSATPAGLQKVPEDIRQTIEQAARKYQLSPALITAIIKVESNFDRHAVSSEGAGGLMQLMPATAKQLGVKNRFDVRQNIDAGSRYLKEMLERFDGKLDLALAAYNAGPNAVEKHGGIPPYRETQKYVRKVMTYC